jgi:phospholipase C
MLREKPRSVFSLKAKSAIAASGALALMLPLAGSAMAKHAPKTVNIRNPKFKHVFIVMEENIGYSELQSELSAGNMPYLQSLIAGGGLATNYFANFHPSIGNYFELITGDSTVSGQISSVGDNYVPPAGGLNVNNVAREIDATATLKNGRPAPHPLSWKVYAEDLPNPPTGPGNGDPYEMHHVPFAYLSDVVGSTTDQAKMVDFTELATDIQNNTLPTYGFIVPNAYHSGHSTDPSAPAGQDREVEVDQWLQNEIAPLVAAVNQDDGLLVVAWDEGDGADDTHGGGQTGLVLVGPKVKKGYQSINLYQEQSVLRLMTQSIGLKHLLPDAASAPQMGEFF